LRHVQPHRWGKEGACNLRACPDVGTSRLGRWARLCIQLPPPLLWSHPRCERHRQGYAMQCGQENDRRRRPLCRLGSPSGCWGRGSVRVRDISGNNVTRYLAWSYESNHPLCDHGYAAGWRPTSAGEDACTSPINGRVP
jgi:hypothetical protein